MDGPQKRSKGVNYAAMHSSIYMDMTKFILVKNLAK
jgi:hypothetical protein